MAKGRLDQQRPCDLATYDIGCDNDQFGFAKFIFQEFGLCFLAKIRRNFFFYVFNETFFLHFLIKLLFLTFLDETFIWQNFFFNVFDQTFFLAKTFCIWQNFIWQTWWNYILRFFSNGWTDKHKNKHTLAPLYYRL